MTAPVTTAPVKTARLRQRGQAAVEMALGTLLLVTVLMFGIFFAEMGYVSLQVQQAAADPLWEATNGQMHDLWSGAGGTRWRHWESISGMVGPEADGRHRDFDGLSSRDRAPQITLSLSQFRDMATSCRNDPEVPFLAAPGIPGNPFPDGRSTLSCTARASALTFRIPTVFVDEAGQGGIFRVPHGQFSIPICAAGWAAFPGQNCRGKYGLLLDEWGFVGNQETQDCGLYACNNTVYRQMVQDIYEANGEAQGDAASRLAAAVSRGGLGPIDENTFFFSAQMTENMFTETLLSSHGDLEWETTPFVDGWRTAYGTREDGFLGYVAPAQVW